MKELKSFFHNFKFSALSKRRQVQNPLKNDHLVAALKRPFKVKKLKKKKKLNLFYIKIYLQGLFTPDDKKIFYILNPR